MARLSDLGEDEVVRRLTLQLSTSQENIIVGPGDDCAVVSSSDPECFQLFKTDAIVEGVHFLKETPRGQVGWKAMARAVSDLAAMGGKPQHALVTLMVPPETCINDLEELYRGMNAMAEEAHFSIVGGETTQPPKESPVLLISVSMIGLVEKDRLVLRSTAKAGDSIFVTGVLGGSLQGHHLTFSPRLKEARWLSQHFRLGSMMDLSDGLAKDLPRLAVASGLGFKIDQAALPCRKGCSIRQALGDGEDYELLFTISEEEEGKLFKKWAKRWPDVSLSRIGRCHEDSSDALDVEGWDHFSA